MPPAAGVSTSSAPRRRKSLRRSSDIDSGIVSIETIAARGGDERERDAGVAARRLDDDGAWAEQTGALGGIDHVDADPVLDARERIEELELGVHRGRRVRCVMRLSRTIGVRPTVSVMSLKSRPTRCPPRRFCGVPSVAWSLAPVELRETPLAVRTRTKRRVAYSRRRRIAILAGQPGRGPFRISPFAPDRGSHRPLRRRGRRSGSRDGMGGRPAMAGLGPARFSRRTKGGDPVTVGFSTVSCEVVPS